MGVADGGCHKNIRKLTRALLITSLQAQLFLEAAGGNPDWLAGRLK